MGRPLENINLFVLQKLFDNFRDVFLIIIMHKLLRDTKMAASWYGYHFRTFSCHGVGPLVRIPGIMDRYIYLDILKNHMEPYAFEKLRIT